MFQTCSFTINEHYHKLFFKAFDHKGAITTSCHIFLHNNYFCRAPLESCFCVWKIFWKFLRTIRNVPCYQSTAVLRSFIVEVWILRNVFKIYLEQLPVKISFLFFLLFCYLLFLFMRKQEGCIFVLPDSIQLSNLFCG